jgi:hypothetical protein
LSDGRYTTRIPEGVSDEEAGPIMCGGVTAYTACKRSAVKPGQWIVSIVIRHSETAERQIGVAWRGRRTRAFCRAVCQSHGMCESPGSLWPADTTA